MGDDRDRSAQDRDEISEGHDRAARARDERADARDERSAAREKAGDRVDQGPASDRAEARRDRRKAARDRSHAAGDRQDAWSDRAVSAGERVLLSIDGLTGAHRRDPGIVELERAIARAKRTGQSFVLVFVDVDGLKAINDSFGHAAGDQLLCDTAETIRANLRPYDLVVRFGGDEFVCGLVDLTKENAAVRFTSVKADLEAKHAASVTVGFSELNEADTLKELIRRADEALYRERRQRRPPGGDGSLGSEQLEH